MFNKATRIKMSECLQKCVLAYNYYYFRMDNVSYIIMEYLFDPVAVYNCKRRGCINVVNCLVEFLPSNIWVFPQVLVDWLNIISEASVDCVII